MGFENMYFHEQQGLATLWCSPIQMNEAVIEPSFISNTGGIGQRAIKLLRRDSVRLYESMHLALFSWEARDCIINPFYLFCF